MMERVTAWRSSRGARACGRRRRPTNSAPRTAGADARMGAALTGSDEQTPNRRRRAGDVAARDKDRRVSVDLASDRRVEHDWRNARRHGLERRHAEAFVLGEERKHRRAPVQVGEIAFAPRSGGTRPVAWTPCALATDGRSCGRPRAVAPDDDETRAARSEVASANAAIKSGSRRRLKSDADEEHERLPRRASARGGFRLVTPGGMTTMRDESTPRRVSSSERENSESVKTTAAVCAARRVSSRRRKPSRARNHSG